MPATKNCMCSVSDHRQKESDGVARQRQCTRTRRPSARERSSTPPASRVPSVDYRAFAKHEQGVFRSLRCFLDESTCLHIDVGSEKGSLRLVPSISCVRLICIANINMYQAWPSSLLWIILEWYQALLSSILALTHNPIQETPTFIQQMHRLFVHIFSFCFHFSKQVRRPARQRPSFCVLWCIFALSSFFFHACFKTLWYS